MTAVQIRTGSITVERNAPYFRRGAFILDVSTYAPFALVPTESDNQKWEESRERVNTVFEVRTDLFR